MGFHRFLYERAYRRGHAPWDTGITPPEVVEVVEGADPLPPGRALDLGCGTGTNVLYLVQHGWQAVGVDFSARAIAEARRKAEGVRGAEFRVGDVTRLADVGVRGPFDFVLDIGCFHSVPLRRRTRYVDGVARSTRPGATLMIFAWGPTPRSPGEPRTREAEVRRRFGRDFELGEVILGREPPGAAWFALRRR
ncbi:MAG TPA: class I SAM-dependent methyltransferase [Actinomycetota bacterium]